MTPRRLAIALAVFGTLALTGVGLARADDTPGSSWAWEASAQQPDPPPTVKFQGKAIKVDWGPIPDHLQIERVEVKKAKVLWVPPRSGSPMVYDLVVLAFLGEPQVDEVSGRTYATPRMCVGYYDADGHKLDPQPPWEPVFDAVKTAKGYRILIKGEGYQGEPGTRLWKIAGLPKPMSSVALIRFHQVGWDIAPQTED